MSGAGFVAGKAPRERSALHCKRQSAHMCALWVLVSLIVYKGPEFKHGILSSASALPKIPHL